MHIFSEEGRIGMSMTEREWQEEQQRVDQVVQEIDQQMESLEQQVGEVRADIVDIRKNFWDDVKLNFSDAGEMYETYRSMKQQADVLSEHERNHRLAQTQLKKLQRLRRSPYFGRIDFAEESESSAEQIYLGIGTVLDEEQENFLVYDWRAPVSSLYYDYGPGPAEYETPGGTVVGRIDLKRQYVIRDAEIVSLFDTGVTIGDELLQEVLGKHGDAQMKSIVATIQREQNQIIRDERSKMLVVQGAAGSGKTSAALQRVAYLLYRYRETLSAQQIVLFSPNPMFNSYVSTVLPELGEENMQQTTFQEYLERRLGKMFQVEDPFEQMEYTLTAMNEPGYEARVEGIKYKASTRFMIAMEEYLDRLAQGGLIFRAIKFRGEVLIPRERIKELFYGIDDISVFPHRMRALADLLLEELNVKAEEMRNEPWVEEEAELMDKEQYQRAHNRLRKEKRYSENSFDDFARELDVLGEMVVQKYFKPLRRGINQLRFLNLPAVYRQFFLQQKKAGETAHWEEMCAQTVERLEQGKLAYEDATPFLYLKERIEGFQTNTQVRHVFVDEAQDYTEFQFAFLRRLFPHAKMTVLGDLNQSIFVHAQGGDRFDALSELFEEGETKRIVLRRSYRSTREIIEFASGLIEGGDEIEPFNRHGSKPTLTQAADETDLAAKVAARIRALQEAGHQTVAVICKTAEESQAAYERLKGAVDVRLIGMETGGFEAGVIVIPSYLAKGMEFDAVILYNTSQERYGRESERKLFYTACTRAMHELHLFTVGAVSEFLAGVEPGSYERLT